MGGAQPLAVTMNEGVCLVVEVDPSRLARGQHRYLDEWTPDLDEAIGRVLDAKARAPRERRAVGERASVCPSSSAAGWRSTS